MPATSAPILVSVLLLAATASAPASPPTTTLARPVSAAPAVPLGSEVPLGSAAAARSAAAGFRRATTRAGWQWPLAPDPAVLRRFLAPPSPYAAGHRGVDLAAVVGDPVRAVASGLVTHAGAVAGRGTVTVLHASGLSSTYEPVESSLARGARVGAGAVLGTVARGSHCVTTCLHLGARRPGQPPTYLDPVRLIRGGPVVLLPLER